MEESSYPLSALTEMMHCLSRLPGCIISAVLSNQALNWPTWGAVPNP